MVGESFHPRGCWGEDSDHIRLGATVQKLLRLFAFVLPRARANRLRNSRVRIAEFRRRIGEIIYPGPPIRHPQSENRQSAEGNSCVAGVIEAMEGNSKIIFRKSLTGSLVLSYTKRAARSCELRTMKEDSNVDE